MASDAGQVTLLWQPTKAQIGTIVLDASIKELHHSETDSTDSPVEKGVDITDHVRAKPDTVTITGMVTNFPLDAGEGPITQSFNGFTMTSAAAWVPGTAEGAYLDLLALKDNPSLIQVITQLRVYQNMVLKSLDVPRDAQIGESVQFTVVLKEIQIVQNQTVQIARASAQQPNQNNGKVVTQPVNKSLAAQGVDSKFVKGFLGGGS